MTPLPKKKRTRRQRGHNRAHQALSLPAVARCLSCGNTIRPHRACPMCGNYNGRTVPGKFPLTNRLESRQPVAATATEDAEA